MQRAIQVLHNAKVTGVSKIFSKCVMVRYFIRLTWCYFVYIFSKETVNMLYNVYTIECKFYFISTPQAHGA